MAQLFEDSTSKYYLDQDSSTYSGSGSGFYCINIKYFKLKHKVLTIY